MSICIEQQCYKNNQFLKYEENTDERLIFTPITKTKWRFYKKIKTWINRYRQRKALFKLDERMLDDIGYTYLQVKKESSKPFWKA